MDNQNHEEINSFPAIMLKKIFGWKDKEMNMCGKIITNFDEKIEEVKDNSNQKEAKIYKKIDAWVEYLSVLVQYRVNQQHYHARLLLLVVD